MEWFEEVERYVHQEPEQFAYGLLTGSQRVGHASLKLRDSDYVERVEKWFAGRSRRGPFPASDVHTDDPPRRLR